MQPPNRNIQPYPAFYTAQRYHSLLHQINILHPGLLKRPRPSTLPHRAHTTRALIATKQGNYFPNALCYVQLTIVTSRLTTLAHKQLLRVYYVKTLVIKVLLIKQLNKRPQCLSQHITHKRKHPKT